MVRRARQRGFRTFVLPAEFEFVAAPDEVILRESEGRLQLPSGVSVPVAPVGSEVELAQVLHAAPTHGVVAIEWSSDRLIPLENAVARRGRDFAVWVVARSPREVPGALGALEAGADLVLADIHAPGDVDELDALLEPPLPTGLEWEFATILGVAPAGLGDRVIVDTTSLLRPEEGLLVGSAAAFLFHVRSEAAGSRFSRPRAFRVNAGAAHSYVLLADGTTRYLAELGPGDAVLIVAPEGPLRSARVGRIKVERRPLVMVRAEERDVTRTVFLQEAESVRLSLEAGPMSTSDLAPGPRARGVRLPPARHLGHPVEETVEER
jgi:3-dehydroquinate synthase II